MKMKLAQEILKKLEAKVNVAKKDSKIAETERDEAEAKYYSLHEATFQAAIDGSENYDELFIEEACANGVLQDKENWAQYRNGELVGLKWALDIVRECIDREKRRAEIEKDEERIWKEITA